jgi:hypothetical protein
MLRKYGASDWVTQDAMATGLSQLRRVITSHAYIHGYRVCMVTIELGLCVTLQYRFPELRQRFVCEWHHKPEDQRESKRWGRRGLGEGSAWMLSLHHMTGPFAVRIDWRNLEVSKILYTALCYFPGSMTATPASYQQTVASVFSAQEQQRMDCCQSVPTGRDRLPISTASWMPCWRAFRVADGPHSNAAWSGGIIEGEREIFSCSTKRYYSCDTSPSGKRGSTSSCLSPDTGSSPTYILWNTPCH